MTSESRIEPALDARLKRMRLCVERADEDTLTIKRVPADQELFSKPRTNLLIKRSTEGMACVVCVDEDLDYMGKDQEMAQAFAAGPTQQGWRILTFGGALHGDLSTALEYALSILGADKGSDNASAAPVTAGRTLLASWAENVTDAIASAGSTATLFRDEAVEQIAACALGWHGRMALILGDSGTGKTNLVYGVASLLAHHQKKLLRVNMGSMMAGTLFESEREALLSSLLREARDSGSVLGLEQAEWALIGVPRGLVLLREALDCGLRLIATCTPGQDGRFSKNPLATRLEIVTLKELCASDTRRVLETLRQSLANHHGVTIDAEVEQAVVDRTLSMDGSLPGKAVRLMDAAAARTRLTGGDKVTLIDVFVSASRLLGENV